MNDKNRNLHLRNTINMLMGGVKSKKTGKPYNNLSLMLDWLVSKL